MHFREVSRIELMIALVIGSNYNVDGNAITLQQAILVLAG